MIGIGVSPTLDVAHAGAVILLLYEECLVYLPRLSPDTGGERQLGVAWNDVYGGLAIVGQLGG